MIRVLGCVGWIVAGLCVAPAVSAQGLLAEFEGTAFGDAFGASVSGIGDVDGDGFDDVIVGAYLEDGNGVDSGVVRVLSGKDGSLLLLLPGAGPGLQLGRDVFDAGDVNADGFPDFVTSTAASVLVVSAKDGAILHQVATPSRPNVSGAGDMNNDGYDDVAFTLPPGASGATVVSGKTGAFGTFPGLAFAVGDLGDLDSDGFDDLIVGFPDVTGIPSHLDVFSGRTGAVILSIPEGPGDTLGFDVAGAGDVDGDGTPDVLASVGDDRAAVYSGLAGGQVHLFTGEPGLNMFGGALDGAGDLDGDGRDDVLVGAPGLFLAGAGYARAFSGADGSVLFTVEGLPAYASGDSLGASVSGLGDVNQDGLPDVAIGAPQSPLVNTIGAGYVRVYSDCGGGVANPYGVGCAGSGGFIPTLRVFGCPTPTEGIDVAVEKGLGASVALVVVGLGAAETPLPGGCLMLVSQVAPAVLQLPLAIGPPGAGAAAVTIRVPASLSGASFFAQAFVLDPAAPAGRSATNGVEVTVP